MGQNPEKVRSGYKIQDDTPTLLSIIILFVILLISIILFGRELILSLKSYHPAYGLRNSPWVGFQNYQELFSSFVFSKLIWNTLYFNLLFAGMSFVITVLLGVILTAVPRMLKGIIAAFFGLLVFLPADVYAGWVIHLLNTEFLVNPDAMRFLFPFLCAVKHIGIPLILIYLRDEVYTQKDSLVPVKVGGLYSLVSLVFIANGFYTLNNALMNPLTYETMDMLDTYSYRKGLLESSAGINASIGIIQILFTIVSAAVLIVPIVNLFRSIFKGERKSGSSEGEVRPADNLISSILAFLLFAIVYFLPYITKGYSFDMGPLGQQVNLISPIIVFIILSFISAMIATALAAAMASAFTSPKSVIKVGAGIILALITVLYVSPIRYSSYLIIRSMGLFDTVYAIILSTCFSSAAVWAMVCIQHKEGISTGKPLYLSILSIFLIQAALVYGNSIPQLLYMSRVQSSPLMILRQLQMGVQQMGGGADRASTNGIIGLYGFLVSLPPLLLFLAVNTFLPKNNLMAVVSAGVKG